jgi:hypothetical protein
MWLIQDWTGKRLWADRSFETFEDGWDHVYENTRDDPEVDDPEFYGEFYVVPEVTQ